MQVLLRPLELSVQDRDLVLDILRKIQADIAGLKEIQKEILLRLNTLEVSVASLRIGSAETALTLARHEARFDQIEARLGRIGKRLELIDS